MRAKDSLPLRIEGAIAFPEAEMAKGDDGLPDDQSQLAVQRVAALIANAEALLIMAGAGMSVDSGLPDFRNAQGFWRAYLRLEKLGLSFEEIAQPHWFAEAPKMAWAWYATASSFTARRRRTPVISSFGNGGKRCRRVALSSPQTSTATSSLRTFLRSEYSKNMAISIAISARLPARPRSGLINRRSLRST